MLWDLAGDPASQVFNSWTTAIKLTWSVPRATRTFLVQKLLTAGFTSAKVDILGRFVNFFHGLRLSPCHEVSVMANLAARDLRTTTSKNLKFVEMSSGMDPWVFSGARVKEELAKQEQVEVPAQDVWRVQYLARLLEERQWLHYRGDEVNEQQVTLLIDSLCIN